MTRLRPLLALAVFGPLALGAALPPTPGPPFTVNGQPFNRLDDAVAALGGGDGTIVVAPGRYPDCAVVAGGRVTIRAGVPGTAVFDGGACEGKATLVLRTRAATVDGLTFTHVRVPDRNGAGIRLEGGDLLVTRATFADSEQGILSGELPGATITIRDTTFTGLGGCPGGMCSHSIYIGPAAQLTVERVRFERGTGGHYLKSRAARITVSDSSFDDARGRETNYLIDLPNGATGSIRGNVMVMGPNKENHSAMIAVAAEARANPSAGLTVTGNTATLAPGITWRTTFLADWSREALVLANNRLGPGVAARNER